MATLYSDAKAKVEKDLDLESEDIITDEEMLGYFNDAIREAEAEVMGANRDYFLDKAYLALVNGTSLYSLPTGIYANKIRGIIYANGTLIYEIKKIRGMQQFLERAEILSANPTDQYQYMIINNSSTGRQIELSPAAKETSSQNVIIWFVRKVAELTGATTDYIDKDIPESTNFIYSYVKGKCIQKENAGIMPPEAQAEIDKQRMLLVETLGDMIPDDDNEAIKDMSFYMESS